MGILLLGRAGLLASKRSSININTLDVFEYAFIDHLKQGDVFPSGDSGGFSTSTKPLPQLVDANGWPNDAAANGEFFGGGCRITGPDQFAGPYVLTWDFTGTVNLSAPNGTTWTNNTTSSAGDTSNTYTGSGGSWSQVAGHKARVILNVGGSTGPQLLNCYVSATGGTDGFVRSVQFYRLVDEPDLLAGKIFRTGFKQILVDWNPHHVRFMDWLGINEGLLCRWEHRNLPSYAGWSTNYTASGQPAYGVTSGANQMTLAAVSAGTFQTPVAMQHGEMATARIGAGMVRATNGGVAVTAISKAATGQVTAPGHGFNTADIVIHQMMSAIPGQAPAGMTQLDNVPCKVTVVDVNNYTIATYPGNVAINTTGYSTFTIGTVYPYITLNVGARGEYPVMFTDGVSPASRFGNGPLSLNGYKTFSFDKNIIASTTVTGAWMVRQFGDVLDGGIPLEICTSLVNEMAAMGWVGDMWVCIPHRGMISTDTDYSAGSNWPVGMVTTILNGANGYAGLDSRCNLHVEHSNESWNTAMNQTLFMRKLGFQRWPALGFADADTYSSLRAVQSIEQIKTAFPGNARIKYVLGAWGNFGNTGGNVTRISGNATYNGDALNIWSPATPLSHFDYLAWAGYLESDDSTPANSLATCTAQWVTAGSDPVAKEAAYAQYVAAITTQSIGGASTAEHFLSLAGDFTTAALAQGKKSIMYEGGWNADPSGSAFLVACKASQTWANALRAFHDGFNSIIGAEAPADYIMVSPRWGHTPTDTYSGGVEGAALDLAWQALKARNNGH